MGPRVFISYRSSDGKDKATALARELGAVFGAAQIFLDKEDLSAGGRWREELERTLGTRPLVLVLLTPQLLHGAAVDDPVALELQHALAHDARVIPLLCDGMQAHGEPQTWRAPYHRLAQFTFRPLRAYDWAHDVQALVRDLKAQGVVPARRLSRGTAALALGAFAVVLAVVLVLGLYGRTPATPSGLNGTWQATWVRGEQAQLVFAQTGDQVKLVSAPVNIAPRADWAEYRRFWRESQGSELNAIVYRGEGTLRQDPGRAPVLDMAVKLHAVPGNQEVSSGNLTVTVTQDRAEGRLWLNSEQADHPAQLRRDPHNK